MDEVKLPPQFKGGIMFYMLEDGSTGSQTAGEPLSALQLLNLLETALLGLQNEFLGETVMMKLKEYFGESLQIGGGPDA
jgi:hypothetical protein